jgi:hypothetical protein
LNIGVDFLEHLELQLFDIVLPANLVLSRNISCSYQARVCDWQTVLIDTQRAILFFSVRECIFSLKSDLGFHRYNLTLVFLHNVLRFDGLNLLLCIEDYLSLDLGLLLGKTFPQLLLL